VRDALEVSVSLIEIV